MLGRVKKPLLSVAHMLIVDELPACPSCSGKLFLIRLCLRTSMVEMRCTTTHCTFPVSHTCFKSRLCHTGPFVHILQRTHPLHSF